MTARELGDGEIIDILWNHLPGSVREHLRELEIIELELAKKKDNQ